MSVSMLDCNSKLWISDLNDHVVFQSSGPIQQKVLLEVSKIGRIKNESSFGENLKYSTAKALIGPVHGRRRLAKAGAWRLGYVL